MERQQVDSSTIATVGYDPATSQLHIEFRHGGLYEYRGVPERLYSGLLQAESAGKFFTEHIRNQFPTVQLR